MRTMEVLGANDNDQGFICIPLSEIDPAGNAFTLCGYVDVAYVYHNHKEKPVTCPSCIRTFKAIKGARAPKGYFGEKTSKR